MNRGNKIDPNSLFYISVIKMPPSVSIVTITQWKRNRFIEHLYQMILHQDYPYIKEWVIVEGSKELDDIEMNELYFEKIMREHNEKEKKTGMKIRFITQDEDGLELSDLRNIGNDNCKGDIIVCMDDDDYYPRDRVSHAVKKLTNSKKEIAGCSRMFMYHIEKRFLYQFDSFGKNHSTNNCMAYKRTYLKHHRYASGLSFAEESSFTNEFQEPMVQLNPESCIIYLYHPYHNKPWLVRLINEKHRSCSTILQDIGKEWAELMVNYYPNLYPPCA